MLNILAGAVGVCITSIPFWGFEAETREAPGNYKKLTEVTRLPEACDGVDVELFTQTEYSYVSCVGIGAAIVGTKVVGKALCTPTISMP